MRITVEERESVVIIRPEGEFDLSASTEVPRIAGVWVDRGRNSLVLDLLRTDGWNFFVERGVPSAAFAVRERGGVLVPCAAGKLRAELESRDPPLPTMVCGSLEEAIEVAESVTIPEDPTDTAGPRAEDRPAARPGNPINETRLDAERHVSNRLLLELAAGNPIDFRARYGAVKPLGAGGMGSVDLVDDNLLERRVAMKRMHLHRAGDAVQVEQFIKEVRVSSRFNHPALIHVYDMGVDPWGAVYYTMRHVEGSTFKTTIDRLRKVARTPLVDYPYRNIGKLCERIAAGLIYAHELGVVHLDLKPENVIVGERDEVVVLDWGLAHLLEDLATIQHWTSMLIRNLSTDSEADLTQTGFDMEQPKGTPRYMAPEQFGLGRTGPVTDVYGFGGILYYGLCGNAPNEGDAFHEIMQPMTDGEPVRPPRERTRMVVPAGLERIAMRCLQRVREERYETMQSVSDDLRRWLEGSEPKA